VVFAEAGQSIAAAAPFTSVMKWTMMRHGNRVKHLGRAADQRKALLRALTTEVLRHGQIKTTKVSTLVAAAAVAAMAVAQTAGDTAFMCAAFMSISYDQQHIALSV
jgi:large subunit ribosomal protein L17